MKNKIAYAEEQISEYLTAMERQKVPIDTLKEKLEAYQQLKQKYETQREELRAEGLEKNINRPGQPQNEK
ncbi:MAG: hypothetical protein LUG24_06765 [Clostridiales bacterium]|nr:hypothetical protein [Clostridiales bacterium]